MRYWQKLKQKWNLKSDKQGVLIMVIFAITGFSILFVKTPVFNLLGYYHIENTLIRIFAYIGIMYPLYQLLLISWGTLFGQFPFFWWMIKKMNKRLIQPFKSKT